MLLQTKDGIQPSVNVYQCAREPKNVLEKLGPFEIAATQTHGWRAELPLSVVQVSRLGSRLPLFARV